MSVKMWHYFEQFMSREEGDKLREAGLVTVTMLEYCDVAAVAERTGLDPVWLQQKKHDAGNRDSIEQGAR